MVSKGERSGVCFGYPGYGRQIFTNCERAADCEYLTLIEDLEGKKTPCAPRASWTRRTAVPVCLKNADWNRRAFFRGTPRGIKRKSLRLLHVSSPQAPHLPGPGRFTTSKSVCHVICFLQKSPSLYRCTAFSVSGDFFAGIYTRQSFVGRALPGKR